MSRVISTDHVGNVVQFETDCQPVENAAMTTAFQALIAGAGVASVNSSTTLTIGLAATVTAAATQTQAGATALTKQVNVITTNATAGNGVALPASPLAGNALSVTV